MTIAGALTRRVDPRAVIFVGLLLLGASMYASAGFSLGMDYRLVVTTGFVQGMGTGFIFVPLSVIAFATLDPKYRNQGSAMFTLVRNLGSAAGISILQALTTRNTAIVHSRLTEGVRADNPVMAWAMPGFDFHAPTAVAALNAQITAQASMVAYTDDFWLLFLLALVTVPLVFLIRKPRRSTVSDVQVHMD
jgi:MFS transporter, DHA2 family, multidrug resistance protein